MTRDVLVSISGLHTDVVAGLTDAENEAIEIVTPANYYCKNGKHYILYDEITEGVHGTTKNKIKITGTDSIEIIKSGLSNTHMVFERNKKNLTYYQTPFGQMIVGVSTRDMEVCVTENNIGISVDYELDINHEPLADCTIKVDVYAKGSDPFS